jgi:hypothetical protein
MNSLSISASVVKFTLAPHTAPSTPRRTGKVSRTV